MKPDSMLVEPEHIVNAGQQVTAAGAHQALQALGQSEPALAEFLHHSLAAVAGKLALSGAPTTLVQGSHEEVLTILLTGLQALRLGQYQFWHDTIPGTPLARLDTPADPPRRRRRKRHDGEADTQIPF